MKNLYCRTQSSDNFRGTNKELAERYGFDHESLKDKEVYMLFTAGRNDPMIYRGPHKVDDMKKFIAVNAGWLVGLRRNAGSSDVWSSCCLCGS